MTSHRSCLFIQPAVEANKFVHITGTERCMLLKYVTSNWKQLFTSSNLSGQGLGSAWHDSTAWTINFNCM